MIPKFPQFKKLEISDKKEIERITKDFPPYSDFNFISMWSWNTRNKIRVSKLNDNIVVQFSDYITNDIFLSFIGKNKVIETAFELLLFSKKHHQKNFLKLIPEELSLYFKFRHSPFTVSSDRDDADYMYLSEHLASMQDWRNNTKAKTLRKTIQTFPKYKVVVKPLKDTNKKAYLSMFHKWSIRKHDNHAYELNEYKAFQRFLKLADTSTIAICVYVKNQLAGFSMYEKINKRYAIAHFSKADIQDYPGIYDILNWEEGRVLHKKNIKFLNWEQDLGISGLRYAKEKYRPLFLLKKIMVTLP
ncbi:MAG: DUF2156 domain-containing protein [Candidatus Pacebacteria bacterium]|nr:DUF2156 domain-containing protein [Candidatus Paceibacterota bacterium]MBP9701111.1 DUF2156 domain-containing protein [Candidatus Paceibacterota bacterium]